MAWLSGGGLALGVLGIALAPGRFEDLAIENPVGLEAVPWLPGLVSTVGGVALLAGLIGSIASLRARYRAARAEQRQQLKWLVYAAGLVGASVLVTLPMETFLGPEIVNVTNTISTLAASTVPIAMGIAILRHRLYDVDLVIRRTLVYGVLTATLAGAYLGSVLLVGLALGRSGLAVAVSTLAVAGLFRPALARIQAAVDRRFYRRRYDAARTLEAFGGRLREELDLEALADDLRGVVQRHGPAGPRVAVAEEPAMKRLAWGLCALWLAVTAVTVALAMGDEDRFGLIIAPALAGFAVVGALIASRHPRQRDRLAAARVRDRLLAHKRDRGLRRDARCPCAALAVARRLGQRHLDRSGGRVDSAAVPGRPAALAALAAGRVVRDRGVRDRHPREGLR